MTKSGANPGRGEVAGDPAVVAEFRRQLSVLIELRAACPLYEFWWEPRWPARPALVARRRPSASCRPHTVVTRDVAELRTILGILGATIPGLTGNFLRPRRSATENNSLPPS